MPEPYEQMPPGRRPGGIDSPAHTVGGQGKSGARPARSRHCDRVKQAAGARAPATGDERVPGKVRPDQAPEARRPVPGQPRQPSRKGWLKCQELIPNPAGGRVRAGPLSPSRSSPAALARGIEADLRVVGKAGQGAGRKTVRTGTTKVKTSRGATCFGRGSGGSGKKVASRAHGAGPARPGRALDQGAAAAADHRRLRLRAGDLRGRRQRRQRRSLLVPEDQPRGALGGRRRGQGEAAATKCSGTWRRLPLPGRAGAEGAAAGPARDAVQVRVFAYDEKGKPSRPPGEGPGAAGRDRRRRPRAGDAEAPAARSSARKRRRDPLRAGRRLRRGGSARARADVRAAWHPAVAAALLLAALAAAGCGLGPGEDVGSVELTVTRDFGAEPLLGKRVEASESDTVMRVLEGAAKIATRYGGGFVQSIDGLAGGERRRPVLRLVLLRRRRRVAGRRRRVRPARRRARSGGTTATGRRRSHVPAVVGILARRRSSAATGARRTRSRSSAGAAARPAASPARRSAGPGSSSPPAARRGDPGPGRALGAAAPGPGGGQLDGGPAESGVYAEFAPRRGRAAAGGRSTSPPRTPASFGPGAGLVAATRRYEAPPTWVVTGGAAGGARRRRGCSTPGAARPLRGRRRGRR